VAFLGRHWRTSLFHFGPQWSYHDDCVSDSHDIEAFRLSDECAKLYIRIDELFVYDADIYQYHADLCNVQPP